MWTKSIIIVVLIVNNIGVEGVKRLAEALESNNTLTSLDLGCEYHVFVQLEELRGLNLLLKLV